MLVTKLASPSPGPKAALVRKRPASASASSAPALKRPATKAAERALSRPQPQPQSLPASDAGVTVGNGRFPIGHLVAWGPKEQTMTRGAFVTRAFKRTENAAYKAGLDQEAARAVGREAYQHAAGVWQTMKPKAC